MRRKQVLIRHFVETAATRTADIEILCVMFDLQDEPDAFTVYQGEVQAIPQTLLNRKVDCWEVENNTLDVIAHVIRGKLNDAPTSIPLRSTHLCILMFMIVDAAVILILMCRNIVNVAIQIAQLL